jgi:hypothetical protein
MAQQRFSECVFNQPGETITFLGIPPNSNLTFRVGEKFTGLGFNDDEDNVITRFGKNEDGSPQSIITQKVLKFDPDSGALTMLGEEKPTMIKSFFPNADGKTKMRWNIHGGRNKRGRKSKKYSKTKSKSRTRRGGRRSRRVRRVKCKSRR